MQIVEAVPNRPSRRGPLPARAALSPRGRGSPHPGLAPGRWSSLRGGCALSGGRGRGGGAYKGRLAMTLIGGGAVFEGASGGAPLGPSPTTAPREGPNFGAGSRDVGPLKWGGRPTNNSDVEGVVGLREGGPVWSTPSCEKARDNEESRRSIPPRLSSSPEPLSLCCDVAFHKTARSVAT